MIPNSVSSETRLPGLNPSSTTWWYKCDFGPVYFILYLDFLICKMGTIVHLFHRIIMKIKQSNTCKVLEIMPGIF